MPDTEPIDIISDHGAPEVSPAPSPPATSGDKKRRKKKKAAVRALLEDEDQIKDTEAAQEVQQQHKATPQAFESAGDSEPPLGDVDLAEISISIMTERQLDLLVSPQGGAAAEQVGEDDIVTPAQDGPSKVPGQAEQTLAQVEQTVSSAEEIPLQSRAQVEPLLSRPRADSKAAMPSSPLSRQQPPFPPVYTPPHTNNLSFPLGRDVGGTRGGAALLGNQCCRFDTFAQSGCGVSASKARDAVLVGSDGALDVYRLLPNKMEVVGRLEGLGGIVVDAKILPVVPGAIDKHLLPLVAVVLHKATIVNEETQQNGYITHPRLKWQATVEVFSLRTQNHLQTLFHSLSAVLAQPTSEAGFAYPEILGDLRLNAREDYISIASAVSGEIHMFRHAVSEDATHTFSCFAKFWTNLQSTGPQRNDRTSNDGEALQIRPSPILALGDRWLVISCPNSSSRTSIKGAPITLSSTAPYGLSSYSPPLQPSLNAEVATVDAEGVVTRLTRQTAQELLKASRKGIGLGYAGWREFTSPTTPEKRSGVPRPDDDANMFPPTHAPIDDSHRSDTDPAVISIIDLDHFAKPPAILGQRQLPPLTSTFALEEGCNFLSLSRTGLSLLTTSRSGETSFVWDLRNAFYSTTSSSDWVDAAGPSIRCSHRLQRNSPSTITDATWTQADHELALRTVNGTTHLHFLAEPERPRPRPIFSKSHHARSPFPSPGNSPPVAYSWLGSIKQSLQTVSTQMISFTSPISEPQPFHIGSAIAGLTETANAARVAGSRAMVRGLTSGYSVAKTGVGDLWHADDNKIRLSDVGGQASLHWMPSADSLSLGILHADKLSVYTIVRAVRMRGKTEHVGLKVEKGSRNEFLIPMSSTSSSNDVCTRSGPHGFWSLRHLSLHHGTNGTKPADSDGEPDDMITNPLYCPLHVDPRINMMVYNGDCDEADPFWCFGQALPPSTKVNIDTTVFPETNDYGGSSEALIESRVTINPVSHEIEIKSHRRHEVDDEWDNAIQD